MYELSCYMLNVILLYVMYDLVMYELSCYMLVYELSCYMLNV